MKRFIQFLHSKFSLLGLYQSLSLLLLIIVGAISFSLYVDNVRRNAVLQTRATEISDQATTPSTSNEHNNQQVYHWQDVSSSPQAPSSQSAGSLFSTLRTELNELRSYVFSLPREPQTMAIPGPQGEKGDRGEQGPAGADAISSPFTTNGTYQYVPVASGGGGTGPQGPVGPAGPQGPAGPAGANGSAGQDGTTTIVHTIDPVTNTASSSANFFEVIINGISSGLTDIINSFTQSVTGNTLTTVINGLTQVSNIITGNTLTFSSSTGQLVSTINGVTSSTTIDVAGPQGPAGPMGPQGATGTPGTNGVDGAQGPQGIQGPQGATGTPGTNGIDGVDGTTTIVHTIDPVSNNLTLSGNTLTSTVNGASSSVNLVSILASGTTNVASSTGNLFETIVNGVSSGLTNIISSLTSSLVGNTLTTTINGISTASQVIGSSLLSFYPTSNVITSTINGVVSTTTISSLNNLILSGNTTAANLFTNNLTATSSVITTGFITNLTATNGTFASSTLINSRLINATATNLSVANLDTSTTLTNSSNTLTSNIGGSVSSTTVITNNTLNLVGNNLSSDVNGVVSTVNLVSLLASGTLNVASSSNNFLETIVNGVSSGLTSLINSNTLTLSGETLTSSVNGIIATTSITGLLPAFTPGSVMFASSSGVLTEDNGNFYWDDTTNRLHISNATIAGNLNAAGGVFTTSTTTNAIISNLSATNATFASSTLTNARLTNATATNLVVTNLKTGNTLTNSSNTLTSNIGGSVATTSIITNNSLTLFGETLTSNVNGITSDVSLSALIAQAASGTVNTFTYNPTGNLFTSSVNGAVSTTTISALSNVSISTTTVTGATVSLAGFTNYSIPVANAVGTLTQNSGFFLDTWGGYLNLTITGSTPAIKMKGTGNGLGTRIYNVIENNGSARAIYGVTASGHTDYGILAGGRAYFGSESADLVLLSQTAGRNIIFGTGGFAASNERMRITSEGNVGIGTENPIARLHVAQNVGANDRPFIIQGAGSTNIKSMFRMMGAGGTLASPSALVNGNVMAQWTVAGYGTGDNTTTYGNNSNARLKFVAEAGFTSTSKPTAFVIDLATSGEADGIERFRITSVGNVGVGTSTPTERLAVTGNAIITGNINADGITLNNFTAPTSLTNSSNILTSNIGGSISTSTIITNNTLSLFGEQLTSNVNGITYTLDLSTLIAQAASGTVNNLYYYPADNRLVSSVNGVHGSTTITSLTDITLNGLATVDTLRFSSLTSASSSATTTNKFLTVDENGDVVLGESLGGGGVTSNALTFATSTGMLTSNVDGVIATTSIDIAVPSLKYYKEATNNPIVAPIASGASAVAIGADAVAVGTASLALGYSSWANSNGSTAVGYRNHISGNDSSAFGYFNDISGNNISVFGSNITNNIANSTMIGPSDAAKVTILGSGNVGIGTTTPTSKLSVVGDINLTGALRTNGDAGTAGQVLLSTGTSTQWVATSSLGFSNSLYYKESTSTPTLTPQAFGVRAVAIGDNAKANGQDSLAVGRNNTASAQQSTALGYNNTVSTNFSTAVGMTNTISGTPLYSGVFGYDNTVSGTGNYGYAVGYDNRVGASNATALGQGNSVFNSGTLAAGTNNVASSSAAVAVGVSNTVTGNSSAAFGNGNTASANFTYVFGKDITNSIASSVMIGPSNAAKVTILSTGNVGIGTTTATQKLTVGGSMRLTGGLFDSKNLSGTNGQVLLSTATGTNWVSTSTLGLPQFKYFAESAFNPFAGPVVSGYYAVAIGGSSNASGDSSIAAGYGSIASADFASAIGYGANVSGLRASAFGLNATVQAADGLALGGGNTVTSSGIYGAAIGYGNTVSASEAYAFGYGIINNIANSMMLGPSNSAKIFISAGGNLGVGTTTTTEKLSVAGNVGFTGALMPNFNAGIAGQVLLSQGTGNSPMWVATSSLGISGGASLQYYAESTSTNPAPPQAFGNRAVAIGYNSKANFQYGVALGYNAQANANNAVALGQNVTALGSDIAVGIDSTASGGGFASAFGKNNTASAIHAAAIGYNNTASGMVSAAFGAHNNVTGHNSSAFGWTNTINGGGSVAIGYQNIVRGANSSAVGRGNSTGPYNQALAFGDGNTASNTEASVFGKGITNTIAYSTMIGPSDAAKLTILGAAGSVGFVGIGTTAPNAKLEINSGATSTSGLRFTQLTNTATTSTTTSKVLTVNGFGDVVLADVAGGGSVAGINGQIQFNNGGNFGATSTLVWDNTNGRLGIGTTSPSSVLAINARRPAITLHDNFNLGQTYQIGVGHLSLGNTDFSVYNASANRYPFVIKNSGQVSFGTSTIPTETRMYVYGGSNGANIDARGDASIYGGDQAVIELQGADYDDNPNSVFLQYYGSGGLGTTAGFNNQKLGVLSFGNTDTALIGTSGNDTPLVFFIHDDEKMRLTNDGYLGIGTTTPSAQLTVADTIRFAALGSAGANLITDSLGNVTVSSDERLKDISGDFASGLEAVLKIQPIQYHWREETGYDTQNLYTGFSAQNVQEAIPEAVAEDSRGFLTIADRPILATIINAIKEIWDKLLGHDEDIAQMKSEIEALRQEVEDLRSQSGQSGSGSGSSGQSSNQSGGVGDQQQNNNLDEQELGGESGVGDGQDGGQGSGDELGGDDEGENNQNEVDEDGDGGEDEVIE